jgi:hypothetical protein
MFPQTAEVNGGEPHGLRLTGARTISNVRMLGPRLTSRGDVDSRDEERGKSTSSRLPVRDEQGKGRKPKDTLDRDSLTILETHDFSDIFRDGKLSAERALSGYGSKKLGAEKL